MRRNQPEIVRWTLLRLLVRATVLCLFVGRAYAENCPSDSFALWTNGQLHGANVFQGRNPYGASNGIGDGDFSQADFDDLARAGANYVHISHAGVFGENPPYALDNVAQTNLDAVVAKATAAGLYVGIAMRSGPGRNENTITNRDGPLLETIWTNQAAQNAWAAMAAHVAARYKTNPYFVGLSVMVEPNAYARHGYIDPDEFYRRYQNSLEDVNVLFARATQAVRAVNSDIPLLLEPEGYGNVTWLPYLNITRDARTVYTPHDYTPFDYTHEQRANLAYPGYIDADGDGQSEYVNKAYLQSYLSIMATFAATNHVPVALTEFGVHRTATNSGTYMADRISLQNPLGSWAVWTWQPAGFIDPFSMHQVSSTQTALKSAWASNCTRTATAPFQPGATNPTPTPTPIVTPTPQPTPVVDTTPGVLRGYAYKLSKKGKVGSKMSGVTVYAGYVSQKITSKLKKRGYSLTLPGGEQFMMATGHRLECHVGSPSGSLYVPITISSAAPLTVNVYCRKH